MLLCWPVRVSANGNDRHPGKDFHLNGHVRPPVGAHAGFRPFEGGIEGAAADGLVDKVGGVKVQGADT
jgi:hypothetical protein